MSRGTFQYHAFEKQLKGRDGKGKGKGNEREKEEGLKKAGLKKEKQNEFSLLFACRFGPASRNRSRIS